VCWYRCPCLPSALREHLMRVLAAFMLATVPPALVLLTLLIILVFPAFHTCASLCGWGSPLSWSAGLGLRVFRTSYPHVTTCFCTLHGPYQHQYSIRSHLDGLRLPPSCLSAAAPHHLAPICASRCWQTSACTWHMRTGVRSMTRGSRSACAI